MLTINDGRCSSISHICIDLLFYPTNYALVLEVLYVKNKKLATKLFAYRSLD